MSTVYNHAGWKTDRAPNLTVWFFHLLTTYFDPKCYVYKITDSHKRIYLRTFFYFFLFVYSSIPRSWSLDVHILDVLPMLPMRHDSFSKEPPSWQKDFRSHSVRTTCPKSTSYISIDDFCYLLRVSNGNGDFREYVNSCVRR